MAKKFGKFLLFTAAIGTAAAAAYYFLQKRDSAPADSSDDDDYDFSDDLDDDTDSSSRNYVPLNREAGESCTEDTACAEEKSEDMGEAGHSEPASSQDSFTPLTEQVAEAAGEKLEEVVEEFFDEEDSLADDNDDLLDK